MNARDFRPGQHVYHHGALSPNYDAESVVAGVSDKRVLIAVTRFGTEAGFRWVRPENLTLVRWPVGVAG